MRTVGECREIPVSGSMQGKLEDVYTLLCLDGERLHVQMGQLDTISVSLVLIGLH